jgi:hypothetical protein
MRRKVSFVLACSWDWCVFESLYFEMLTLRGPCSWQASPSVDVRRRSKVGVCTTSTTIPLQSYREKCCPGKH